MTQNYYLTIDGIAGDSTSQGHEGAFDISDYSFDVSAIVSAVTGGGAGKATFSPLTVDLDLNSGMTALLKDIATGKHIPSIELKGVSADGQTVYDLKLGNVILTTYHDTNSGHDTLAFSYQQVSLTTTPQQPDGTLGTPITLSWDVATNTEGASIPDPVIPAGGPTGGGAQTYFLAIDGIAGDSTSTGHEGAFNIADYSFDVSAIVSAVTGGGAGKATFSPLTIDLDLNSGMTALLKDIATGKHIPSIELKGVSADGHTVYDLKLGNVILTTYHDTNSGHDTLAFNYQQVSLTTTPQNLDGSLGTPITLNWDVAANTIGTDIPDPVIPAGGPTGGGAQTYFLAIDGIAGDSTSTGHEGAFDISDYSFDVSAIVSAVTGGGAGKATFSPLTVDLDLNSGMTALLKDIATGKHIPSIELKGVSADGHTVYDLKLGNVILTTYHDTNSGHDTLAFSYQQVSLTTTPQQPDGTLGTPITLSWDVATNTEGASIPDPVIPAGGPTGGGAQTYFLAIDGIAGDSTSTGHEGAFDISDYSFDVSAIVSAVTGGGAGKATFSPLTIDLDLNSGMTALLKDIATGKHIPSIELKGVSADGHTVYDLKLGNVILTTYHDTNSGHDTLAFSYQQVSLTTTPQQPDGTLGTPITLNWDVATNTEGASIPDPVIPAGGPTGGGAQTYFLAIDGIAGDSTSQGHEGAFDISDYSFDVSAIVSAVTGGGAGKATFSPLTIDLDLNSGMTALLKDIATGKHIPSIELKGVSADGHTVYDLKLGNVILTTYHDTNSGHDTLAFSYQQVSLTTTPQNLDGSLGTPVTLNWDVAANTIGTVIPDPVIPAVGPTGDGAPGYFLTIDGIAGDSTSTGHEGAFDISDYSFDVSAIVSAVTGGGAGKATFSPLTIDLDLNSGMTALLKDIATGKHIPSIELKGVSADGHTVYDLKLGNVILTTYHDTNSGHDTLAFSYQQVSLTTTPQNLDGSLGTPVTLNWDVAANTIGTVIPDPVIPAVGPTGDGAPGYFLTIDGIAGDSTSTGHEGAFDISDYSFDVSAIVSAVTGGGAAAGTPTFSPLTVDLDLNSGMTALLKDIATGKHIPSIELKGVSADGHTVYDLKLGDVILTTYHDTNSGHDTLAFSYQQVSLTTTPQQPDGTLGTPITLSWDVATNTEGASIPDPVIPAGGPTGGGAQTYFLAIDGIAGDSTSTGHEGAFDISDYSFDVSAIVSAVTGGGAGKATFSPLTVDLDLNSGMTALLKDIATGKHIPSIELKGVSADGHTVYDLKLGDVILTTYHDTNSGHDTLAFNYQQVSLTTTPQQPDGTLGTPITLNWDVAANTIGTDIPDPVIPAGGPTGGGAQTYFLAIDGIAGDSTSTGHEGAFDISDYSFDVSAIVSAVTGGGAGKATFSPLTVDLDLNSGMTALLKDIATGKHIPSIELKGVSADGQTVYDLKLGNVILTTDHDTNSGHDTLAFSYQQVSLTTTPQQPDGTLGTPVTLSWDVATNTEGADIPDPTTNHAPIALDDIVLATTGIGGTASGNVLGNDSDADGDHLAVTPFSGAGAHGNLTLNADGSFSYAVTNLVGATSSHLHDVFSYTESDGHGGLASANLDITLNRGPVALDDAVTATGIGGAVSGNVFGNDSDADGDSLAVTPFSGAGAHGNLTLNADGSFSYAVTNLAGAAAGSHLHDVFRYTESDGHGGLASANLDITLNRGPVAHDDAVTATGIGGTASGNVLGNDSDADGDNLAVTPFSGAGAHGNLTLNADGSFSYAVTNLAGTTGSHLHDVFRYTESDGHGGLASANLDITLNRGPVAQDDAVAATTVFVSGNVLNNDSDADGDSLAVTPFSGVGAHGNLALNANGSFSYVVTNLVGATGSHLHDVFRYTESDGHGGLAAANLDITLNRGPVAHDDAVTATGIGGIASGNVFGNDSDADGDHLAVTSTIGAGAHGNLTLKTDGSFSYTVTNLLGLTGSHLHDVFRYTESDGHGGLASANLDITLNRGPVAHDDAVAATAGIGGTASGNVLGNDSDADGDHLAVTPFSGAGAHGNLTLNADGSFSYAVTNLVGATGSHLHDVFSYTESDGHGGLASANLDITLNRGPIVLADIAGVKVGAVSTGNVLSDDTDSDGDALSVTAINGGSVGHAVAGSFGTLVLNGNGSYSYTAKSGAAQGFAQDTFTFTESDGHGGSVQSALTFSIVSSGQTYFAGTPGQTLVTGNSSSILDGTLGNQHLVAGNGADVLIGGNGDVLTGNNGLDQFVFKGSFGRNEVTDFKSPDSLQLDKSTFGTAANVLAHDASDDGHGNTIITDPHNSANVIVLDHVSLNQLHTSDFLLV